MSDLAGRGIQYAQFGMLANTGLAVVKLIAGLLGNSYALVADAVESIADIFSSLIVWGDSYRGGRPQREQSRRLSRHCWPLQNLLLGFNTANTSSASL